MKKESKIKEQYNGDDEKEPEVNSLVQWLILVFFVIVFLIPMWISNYLGLKGVEALVKVEAPGWAVEVAVAGIVTYIEKKKGNWK